MSPPPLLSFVLDHVLDQDHRLPAVLGRDRGDVVTTDRTLRDAALAILVLSDHLDRPGIRSLLVALNEFLDPEHPGYHELLDVTGAPHAVGQVRTPRWQALAAWACHFASTALGEPAMARSARAHFGHLTTTLVATGWPALLDRSGSTVLDHGSLLEDVAISVLAAHGVAATSPVDDAFVKSAAAQLRRFRPTGEGSASGGPLSRLTAAGDPDQLGGYTVVATALDVLAWCVLHEYGEPDAIPNATSGLHHIDQHHRRTGRAGFWDRADATAVVRVDPIAAYHCGRTSPFPARIMLDHAVLLLAANRLGSLREAAGVGPDEVTLRLANDAAAELLEYTDPQVGGVFQGVGSWFSTPVDPTVPLARHVMVPPHTQGAFAVGNTAYVPFHEKHAVTQLVALAALGDRQPPAPPDSEPSAPAPQVRLESWPIKADLSHAATAPLTTAAIDLPGYLAWLRSTASGLGYGLTPYHSPLGLRSDRTTQTFSALHVISDLLTLGQPIPDPEGLLTGVFATQNPDGGFGEQPGLLSEVFTTYCAVLLDRILRPLVTGGRDYDRAACVEFLNACQHPAGGFGNAPGYPCDSWHSNLAVLTLHALGRRPPREADLIEYLVSCQNSDGGYGPVPGTRSDTFATFRVIDALVALGLRAPRLAESVAWLKGLQTPAGGFRYREGGAESFVGSYHAIAGLYIVGALPTDVEACRQWITSRQSRDGGFARAVGAASETTDEGFIAIQALHMLEGKLNPYWAVIMT